MSLPVPESKEHHSDADSALTQTVPENDDQNAEKDFEKSPNPPASHAGSEDTRTAHETTADEKGEVLVEEVAPARKIRGVAWVVVVIAILSSTFLFALDNTVVADVQPNIVESLGEIQKLPWLPIAFLVAAVSTNLIWGKVYGQLDAKWLYITFVFLFEVGSALCGAANSMNTLIGGRVLAGLGGSGMYVGVMTLLSITTSEHERPVYIGFTGLTWGLGTVLGPIIGGAFAGSKVGWRWAFYINLFIGAVCAPVYIFMLPSSDPRPGVPYKKRLRQLDYFGTLLIIGACVSGVMAISFGGVIYAWNSAQTIALFVVSGVLFIAFGVQQRFTILTSVEERIFPIQFLKSKDLIILFMQTSCGVTSLFVPIYFIPLFFQFVRNDSAIEAGVRLLPFVCLLVVFVILNGALLSRYGYYMPWYLWGGIMIVIGASLMHTVDQNTSTSAIYGYSILIGIGAGSFAQASFSVAQVKVPKEDIPSAIGFISMAQIGGATIALAIANTVFLNQATKNILVILPDTPVATVQGAIAGAGSAFFKSLSEEVREQVLAAVTAAIGRIYILAITAGVLTIILSVFMSREKLFLSAGAAG